MSKIILCADDSATMQQVAEITFKATEFTYVGARSADEALDKARKSKPALVLADAVMPGKTGYDLCEAIKADPALADIPVVILCGNSQAYDPARGAQVGADGSLSKPWDTQVLLDKLTEIVEKGPAARPSAAAPAAAPTAVVAPKPAPVVPPIAAPPVAHAGPGRSATIMGMPSIKIPPQMGGPQPAVAAAPPAAVPPVAVTPVAVTPVAVTPVAVTPVKVPEPARPVEAAPAASAPAPVAVPGEAPARAPMVAAVPTRRSELVDRTLARMAARLAEATGLQPGSPELLALLKLSTEVVERVVWEVVPDLAEQLIRENLQQLAAARRN